MTPDPQLLDRVRDRLAAEGGVPTPGRVAAALRLEGGGLRGDLEVLAVLRSLQSEIVGAGPLEPLLADPLTTDVLVNGPDQVWADRGAGLERVAVRFSDEAAVRRLAARLAAPTGTAARRRPAVGRRSPARRHPAARRAATRCVRRHLPVAAHPAPSGLRTRRAGHLRHRAAGRSRPAASAGQGAGRLPRQRGHRHRQDHLAVRAAVPVDDGDRLLLVEGAGELVPDHPHVVRLEARPPNVEGAGEVSLRDLVRQALRMRPDRLVVGEVRGAEVVDLLAALNTGHEGGCGTLHANRATDVPARLEALAAVAGLAREALHSQLASGLRVAVHLARAPGGGARRMAEVCVLRRSADGLVVAEVAWSWDGAAARGAPGPATAALAQLLA